MNGLERKYIALWAKSPKQNEPFPPHTVIAHLLDVAASTTEILNLEPQKTRELYAEDFDLPEGAALRLVAALAGLHDLGKASPAFQQLWPKGLEELVKVEPEFDWRGTDRLPPTYPNYVSHSLITQTTLPKILQTLGYPANLSYRLADAVGCHHGFRANATELETANRQSEKGVVIWDTARQALVEAVLFTLDSETPPPVHDLGPAAFMRLAGLTSFADWIGSSLYPDISFAGFENDLVGYYEKAKKVAAKRLAALEWSARLPLSPQAKSYAEVFGYLTPDKPFVPRTLQTKLAEIVEGVTSPTLLLVEAPMGEGKTEAAFYAYLRLQAQLGHRGLYIALPTMATGNAMFSRTAEFLNAQAEGRNVPLDLQLLHGATQLNDKYQELQGKLRANPGEELLFVQAREYFTSNKHGLLSEYAVGTVDQALLTVLNIRHQFVRLWGLGNRGVVIDEVHAYDTYTSELITTLVRWLHTLGSSVILMSATLPADKRAELLAAYGGESKTVTSYPRIFSVTGGKTESVTFDAEPERRVRLQLKPLGLELDAIVELLEDKLAQGGCAVCIVNTVDRAQQLFEALTSFKTYLFHARYPAEDRAAIEDEVNGLFGKKATLENGLRPRRAVLVGTQTIEQSLDLDFDLMVSDLAPIDLLIQRAGRLWRHARPLRPLKKPELYIAGMRHDTELPDLEKNYWHKIYAPYVLYKTWDALRELTELTLPDDIDRLVQKVYDGQALESDLSQTSRDKIEKARADLVTMRDSDLQSGKHAVISKPGKKGDLKLRPIDRVREEDDKSNQKPLALTRKGEPSVTVIPLYRLAGQYFLDQEAIKPYVPNQPLAAFKRAVRLSRKSLVAGNALIRHNEAQKTDTNFKSWEKDPLLRNCVPLVLDEDGKAQIGKTIVRLDERLGIVYEQVKQSDV